MVDDKEMLANRVKSVADQVTTKDLLLKAKKGLDFLIADYNQLKAAHKKITDRIVSLYPKLAHGDEKHKEWLRKTIEDHFNAP